MRRTVSLAALLAAVAAAVASAPASILDEPLNPVTLHRGWQMVSFPILESKPLADFDVILPSYGVRYTFEDASAPGEPWLEAQLWWYDPATQGYHTLVLGGSVEPNRGYWVYSHVEDPLYMVPTYDVTDSFQHQPGSALMMDGLTSGYPETYGITTIVEAGTDICGLLCSGWYTLAAPFGGGDLYDERRDWLGFSGIGMEHAGIDYPSGSPVRFDPPLLVPNRMYAGETYTQIVALTGECGGPALDSATRSVRCLGPTMIGTNLGDMLCLEFEEITDVGGGSSRKLRWVAPPLGDAQSLYWVNGRLDSVQTVSAWWP